MNRRLLIPLFVFLAIGCSGLQPLERPAVFQIDQLVDANGISLYTFDRDIAYSGKSLCEPSCGELWRPFLAPPGARRIDDFALISRVTSARQWTYRGKPLYRYASDLQSGDAKGDGIDNMWRLAVREIH
jgi:predicted lipoprotein with Yx(FWY)xxD motif